MKRYLIPFFTLFTLNAMAQPAALDLQFGINGIARHAPGSSSEINNIEVDAQGNIYSAGYVLTSQSSGVYRLTVSKTLPNGQADPSFGSNGITEITIGASEFPLDLVVAANGKVLVSGSAYTGHTPTGPGDYNGFVARLNANGTLDATFAQGGVFHFLSPNSHFSKILLRSNGSLLLCGNSNEQSLALQLLDNGSPDIAFGNNGYFFLNTAAFKFIPWSALQEPDGSVIMVGCEATDADDPQLAYCKLNPQGGYDLSFGNDGYMMLNAYSGTPAFYEETLNQVRKGSDGKYYMGGFSTSKVMLRVNSNGSMDAAYGVNGMLSHSYPYKDFVVQPDGKLLLSGSKELEPYNYGWAVTRLNTDGSIDPSFANGPSFDLDLSDKNDYVQSIKLFNDALFVAGSSYHNEKATATMCKVKLDGSVGIKDKITALNIALYPNPAGATMTVDAAAAMSQIDIIDINGRIIQQHKISDKKTAQISCNFIAGTYIMSIHFKNGEAASRPFTKL